MLVIGCTLLRDEFEGSRPDDPRSAEWPPSWMRLFSALVSVAEPGDDEVLRRLEEADPPHICAPRALTVSRSAYVPTNQILKETRHTQLYARTNGERRWARAIPREPRVTYIWPELQLDPDVRERLRRMCRRVPYLGRSTSPALIELVNAPPGDDPVLVPETAGSPEDFELQTTLRTTFPGALFALRETHRRRLEGDEGSHVWAIGRGMGYGRFRTPDEYGPIAGPYRQMVILGLQGPQLDGRHAARVTHAVRRAVLSRAEVHLPSLHGHHDGDIVQCAFVALPDVGHEHADGHILGVAIALPELPAEEQQVIVGAIGPDGLEVTAGPLGILHLQPVNPLQARLAYGLRAERWTKPRRRWATAFPMVFDRFPGRKRDLTDEVARSVVNARFPEPVRLGWSRHPVVPGGVAMLPRDTLRRQGDSPIRPFRHVWVEFAQPVRGPVVIGSMRHYGLGLCIPLPGADDSE